MGRRHDGRFGLQHLRRLPQSVKAGAEQERFHNSVYEAADFTNPEKIVAILDDLWQNADERIKDRKAEGQLAFFVTSDLYYAYEKYLDSKGADAAYAESTNGRQGLAYHGIPLVDVRLGAIWPTPRSTSRSAC